MDRERLRQPSLPEAVSEVLSDFADLFRKELQLARAELSWNLSHKLRGGIWIGLAGLVGAVAVGGTVGAKQVQRARGEYVDADPDEV